MENVCASGRNIPRQSMMTYSNPEHDLLYSTPNVTCKEWTQKGRFCHKYLIYIIPLQFPVKANMLSVWGVHKASVFLIIGWVQLHIYLLYATLLSNMQRQCTMLAEDKQTLIVNQLFNYINLSKTTPTSSFLVIIRGQQ